MIALALLLAAAVPPAPDIPEPCRPSVEIQQLTEAPETFGPGLSVAPCVPIEWQAHDITGRPPLTLTWLVDGVPQTFGDQWVMDAGLYPAGFHVVTFRAENPWGSASQQSFVIVEKLEVPAIQAEQNPTSSLTATVFATSPMEGANQWRILWGDGTATDWSCDFRDPALRTPHAYARPGSYSVRLQGHNCREGPITSPPLEVTVGSSEAIQILEFQVQGCVAGFCSFEVGESLVFDQEFSAVPTELRYDWDGDGEVDQVASSPVGSHQYRGAGVFRPRLTVLRGSAQDTREHSEVLLIGGGVGSLIFEDGFESGKLWGWSESVPD